MTNTLNKKLPKQLLLRQSLELCGMNTYNLKQYFDSNGDIQFRNNSSLEFIHNMLMETDLYKAMYLYLAGEACKIILGDIDRQLDILSSCNLVINKLRNKINTKYDDTLSYAMYFTMYLKIWIVENIPNLQCEVCKKTYAKEYDFDDLVKIIQEDINKTQNKKLYRLIAYMMMSFDEADKATQIMSLVCSWYEREQDITDLKFMQASCIGFENLEIDDRLTNIKTCESYIIQSYIRENMGDKDALVDAYKILYRAIETIEEWCVNSFIDLINLTLVMRRIVCLTNENIKYVSLFYRTIDNFLDIVKSPFMDVADFCGVNYMELQEMFEYFTDSMDIMDGLPKKEEVTEHNFDEILKAFEENNKGESNNDDEQH